MRTGPVAQPVEARFWPKVDRKGADECWPWLGTKSPSGYGTISVGSRSDGSRKKIFATRIALELAGKPHVEGMFACHACDNPECVNPAHLFWGTASDNMQDALAKGRLRKADPSRTRCRHGHELTPENTLLHGHLRYCRQCRRDAAQRHYQRNAVSERMRKRLSYAQGRK